MRLLLLGHILKILWRVTLFLFVTIEASFADTKLFHPEVFQLKMEDNDVSEALKIQQLQFLAIKRTLSQTELRCYLKVVKTLIEVFKPARKQKPKVLWLEALKTYLTLTNDFYALSRGPDTTIRRLILWLALGSPEILPSDFWSPERTNDLIFKEADANVRLMAIRLLAKHGPETQSSGIFRKRVFVEKIPFVRNEMLGILGARIKTGEDLEFVLKRLEKNTWNDDTKKVLLEVKPMAEPAHLNILSERLQLPTSERSKVLPVAFLCGTWGLPALQKIISLDNPSEELVNASIEGLKTLKFLTWDSSFLVQNYIDLLNSHNPALVQLAALALQKGKKVTTESLKEMRRALTRSDLSEYTLKEVGNMARRISVEDIEADLKNSDPPKRIEALLNLTDRCERVNASDIKIRRILTRKAITILKTDPSEVVRASALAALQSPGIYTYLKTSDLHVIASSLKDENLDIRTKAVEFFNNRRNLPSGIQASVVSAQTELTGDAEIPAFESTGVLRDRLETLNSLSPDQLKTSGVKAQLRKIIASQTEGKLKEKALTLIAENTPPDEPLKQFLFEVASKDSSPEMGALAVKLIGAYFPSDFSIFHSVIDLIKNNGEEKQLSTITAVLEKWPLHTLRFDTPENKNNCEKLINILISDFDKIKLTRNRKLMASWLQYFLELAKDDLPHFKTISWEKLSEFFSQKEHRLFLLKPIATLFAIIPEKTLEILEESFSEVEEGPFYLELIGAGNRKLTHDILKASSQKIMNNWIQVIRQSPITYGNWAFTKTDVYILLEYLKSNPDNNRLLKATLEKLCKIASRIVEDSDFYISETLGLAANNIKLPIPLRILAAKTISRLKTKNRELNISVMDTLSRLPIKKSKPRGKSDCAKNITS